MQPTLQSEEQSGPHRDHRLVRLCARCSKPFKPRKSSQQSCSKGCASALKFAAGQLRIKAKLPPVVCDACGKNFAPKGSLTKYCSLKCCGRAESAKQPDLSITAGPKHRAAKVWRLRSPDGRTYEFKNLQDFIRQHSDLFDPSDVEWVKSGRNVHCRASGGLASISARRAKAVGSWKGWTVYSQTERLFNGGEDLLNRDFHQTNDQVDLTGEKKS